MEAAAPTVGAAAAQPNTSAAPMPESGVDDTLGEYSRSTHTPRLARHLVAAVRECGAAVKPLNVFVTSS